MRSELIKEVNERFIKDTANHKIEILLDNGLYRHLKFSNNGSSVYRFDIITWPGYLAVSGDMGEYMFSRLPDMFEFFRNKDQRISIDYWAEKCRASKDGIKEYSAEKTKQIITEQYKEYLESKKGLLSEETRVNLEVAFNEFIYYCEDDNGIRAQINMNNIIENNELDLPYLENFWEYNLTEYKYHFIWILHAIVWGIDQYDKSKTKS